MRILAAVATLLVGASALHAQAITSKSDPALAGATVIDFNSMTTGVYTSFVQGDVTFSTPTANEAMYLENTYSGSYGTTGVYIANTYNADAFGLLRFGFANPVSALAFNWGASDQEWTLSAFGAGGALLASITTPITGSSNDGFTGIKLGSAEIAYAELSGPSGDYVMLDDFQHTGASTVPEPVTMVLFGSGLLGLGAARRRRRSAE